ncbi:MAG TPA: hypothetical protein VGP07_24790 [Polyangia bacterium]|jgi:hypothetical protein
MKIISKVMLGTVILALGACGSSSSGGNLSKVKGTWQPTSYSSKLDCGADGQFEDTTGSNVVWSMGVASDLVQSDPTTNCIINADLTGYTASAVAGQSCTLHDTGSTIAITLSAYTFSLSADFQTATENGSGNAQVTFSDGTSASCSYNLSASYHKVGT